ncbi:MAG: tryptophan-rich sensory protein [Alphaproteobacteria bacterium]|nr:tryptophan-rich sensory protein [Alphaproteobacteria bacterium]
MRKKIIQISSWILIFEVIGFYLGLITKENINPWYQLLNKPIFTPPNMVFSIIWPILYVLLALASYLLWQHRRRSGARTAIFFYATQILMNWLWTPLFFYFHFIGLSFLWIIIIAVFTLTVIYLTKDKFKLISIMLIPYFAWLVFAVYLNGGIWVLN